MARGTEAKEYITNKLLEVFEGAFLNENGKEIRIPYTEDGEDLEIKVSLTCAKTNVREIVNKNDWTKNATVYENPNPQLIEPTKEEKERVQEFLNKLNS